MEQGRAVFVEFVGILLGVVTDIANWKITISNGKTHQNSMAMASSQTVIVITRPGKARLERRQQAAKAVTRAVESWQDTDLRCNYPNMANPRSLRELKDSLRLRATRQKGAGWTSRFSVRSGRIDVEIGRFRVDSE